MKQPDWRMTGGGNGSGATSLAGRWPANVLLDEEAARMLDEQSGECKGSKPGTLYKTPRYTGTAYANGKVGGGQKVFGFGDSGGASRFFYTAKASRSERGAGNNHPTVKPIKLMRYLAKLTATPTGGTVLDPFMGSGSTGLACQAEQFSFIGCEMSPEYAAIAERRMRDAAGLFADITVAA
jgi:hypothetical protein